MALFTTQHHKNVRDAVIGVVPVDCYRLLSASPALRALSEHSVILAVLAICTITTMEAVLRVKDAITHVVPVVQGQT